MCWLVSGVWACECVGKLTLGNIVYISRQPLMNWVVKPVGINNNQTYLHHFKHCNVCRNVVRFDPISNKVIDKLCCRILVSFNNTSLSHFPSALFPGQKEWVRERKWQLPTDLSRLFRLCSLCVCLQFANMFVSSLNFSFKLDCSHNKLTPNRYLCNRRSPHWAREGSSMIIIKQFKWVSIRSCAL